MFLLQGAWFNEKNPVVEGWDKEDFLPFLTLNLLNYFKDHYRCIQISWHTLDFVQQKKTKFTGCLSQTDNTMSADALVTSGTRSSAGIVLTPKAGRINTCSFCKIIFHSPVIVALLPSTEINTLRPRQNGHHLPDDMVKWIFLNEISINISLKFVLRCTIKNIATLVQIMA